MHIFRALFTALKMTLRGEELPDADLRAWMQTSAGQVEAVYTAAEQHGLDKTGRESLMFHLDSRDVSLETILAGIRHHVTEEYPHLLRDRTPYSLAAIHAANLDDRYRITQLKEQKLPVAVKESLATLSAHLEAIPPVTDG